MNRTLLYCGLLVVCAACSNGERRARGMGPPTVPGVDAGLVVPDDAAVGSDAGDVTDGGARDGGRSDDAGPAETDAGTVIDGGPPDGGPRDAGSPDAGAPTCPAAPGRLAIVEIMIASQSGTDLGEWFEVLNTGSCTVDLRGVVLSSPTSSGSAVTHTVTAGTVAPGAGFVLALSGDPTENHGLRWDYVYGSGMRTDLFLGNSGDTLSILDAGGREIDSVSWGDAFTRGYSRQLPRTVSPASNHDWSLWCDSTAVYSTMGGFFYGTPGTRNGTCP